MMATAESSNDSGRHLDLLTTLPDIVLNHILCLVFDHTNQCTINAIMINRRISSLAKPIFLSTIVLHSELSVLHLMHHCLSPNPTTLTAADREHVKCIEVNFLPSSQRQTLRAPSVLSAATAFPNLRTLRFRFNAGVPLLSSLPTPELYRQLAVDTAAHARWLRVDSPLFDLLSSLKPQRFEWISEVPSGQSKSGSRREGTAKSAVRPIRVLAFRGAFRALIKRWDSLTHVDLDGICLLAKHCTSTFHLALLAKHMRINVNSYRDTLCLFASVPHMLSGSHKCESLVVDGPGAKQELAYVYNAVLRPGTSLTFRGFTSAQCALFKYTFLSVDDQRFFGPVPPDQVFRFVRTGVRELRPREISRKTSPMTASVTRPSATVPSRDKATTGPPTSGEGETHPALTSILSTVDYSTYIVCFIAIPITICCTILFLMILPVVDYLKRRRGAVSTTTTSVATSAPTAPQDKPRSRGLNLYTESR